MKARGLNRTVVMRNNDIGQMLCWTKKRKPWRDLMADGNPADLVEVNKPLDQDYQEQRDRLLSPTKSATSSPASNATTTPFSLLSPFALNQFKRLKEEPAIPRSVSPARTKAATSTPRRSAS